MDSIRVALAGMRNFFHVAGSDKFKGAWTAEESEGPGLVTTTHRPISTSSHSVRLEPICLSAGRYHVPNMRTFSVRSMSVKRVVLRAQPYVRSRSISHVP